MKNKVFPLIVGVAAVVIGLYLFSNQNTEVLPVENPDDGESISIQGYTLEEVSIHNSQSDCWSAINGSVYDLTSWVSRHPGGEQAILNLCGTDGSTAFNAKHGGQKKQADTLSGLKIGELK